jgi:hypothetical protein
MTGRYGLVTNLGSVVRSFQHHRAVAKLLYQTILALDSFDKVSIVLL